MSSCPEQHVSHSFKEWTERSLPNAVSECCWLPLLTSVWCHLEWPKVCVCIDPLCSPISLVFVPRDPNNDVSKLARLLSVTNKTIGELTKYYDKPIDNRETDTEGHTGQITAGYKTREN